MWTLFDQGTPVPARHSLNHHVVSISADLDLLVAAERAGFVVIGHSQWPALKPHMQRVVEAVDAVRPGW